MARIEGIGERIHWPLYDAISLPTATTGAYQFLTVPLGQSSKTLVDTNMRQGGRLSGADSYEVRGFSLAVDARAAAADAGIIASASAFRFVVDAKEMFSIAPGGKLGGGMGVFVGVHSGTAISLPALGLPDPRAIYVLSEPFSIDAQQGFVAELVFPVAVTLTVITKVWLTVEGIMTRSVQ